MEDKVNSNMLADRLNGNEIAIIGMAGRFPGAKNIDAFWSNLCNGIESISFFSDEELLASGIVHTQLRDPRLIRAGGVLENADMFDSYFFGYAPQEAEIMDPQHRLFLECAWEALEHAGYSTDADIGPIGVYAGLSTNNYLLSHLHPSHPFPNIMDDMQATIGNEHDFLTTRVSYKLDLRGPSLDIQTACSTSLVAIHVASQSLLNGECMIALAGGVRIQLPQKTGYLYQEGGIDSPDGHCRSFDAQAQGTVGGNGLGVVVLKRFADALADGDTIHAIIKGSAINNDGAVKVSYTAPSILGQAAVISEAMAMAGVDPETVGNIEAHGTATPLGDPIEIAALTRAFGTSGTTKKSFCAIGSVKTNIGHLDKAAGVAGLIKTVLALKHHLIPPSLHFQRPNPQIDFENSPFYVNTKLAEWKERTTPRRAGVSSFGMGGTNAHVVLEEAPLCVRPERPLSWQVLLLSAKTSSALENATKNLTEHLKRHPDLALADVAYTLQVGRKTFNHRRMIICSDSSDAITALETANSPRLATSVQETRHRHVAFMFPGQGTQYVNMARELYETETGFRIEVNHCAELLSPHLGLDLLSILYPSEEETKWAQEQLQQTWLTQSALFVIEYALAKLWMSWGVIPSSMIGHSIGEYVAACLAGVFSLEDALRLIAARGHLMQQLPKGAMVAVALSGQEIEPLLNKHLSLASVNASTQCVVSGTLEAVESCIQQLTERGVPYHLLHTSHAFHSAMVEPILEGFAEQVRQVRLYPPKIPYVSNLTGTWISGVQATDVSYWVKHLRNTVFFGKGIRQLLEEQDVILLEVGPGTTLKTLARQNLWPELSPLILSTLHSMHEYQSDRPLLLNALGRLWLAGMRIDWQTYHIYERCYRVPLPTYPFESQRHVMRPSQDMRSTDNSQDFYETRKAAIADWFYVPYWKQAFLPPAVASNRSRDQKSSWLVFSDNCGVGHQLGKQLVGKGHNVITVLPGEYFAHISDVVYTINPRKSEDYTVLLKQLSSRGIFSQVIIHLWSVTTPDPELSKQAQTEVAQQMGFYSLLFLTQALEKLGINEPMSIRIVSNNMQRVTDERVLYPEKATLLGLCMVIPQEYPFISCSSIDIELPLAYSWQEKKLFSQLIEEFMAGLTEPVVAYRGQRRWVQEFGGIHLNNTEELPSLLREGGVYLIIGGLGRIGLTLAGYLAQSVHAKLVLTGRSPFPAKDKWARWLTDHGEDDKISKKIWVLQNLESLGAEIIICQADVASQEQMQAVLATIDEQFGVLHGVLHSAGIVGDESICSIQEANIPDCEKHFQAKLDGLLVLERLLRGRTLDFCLIQSSLSSILGGLGFVAYAAANLFVDAWVHKQNVTGSVPWISINWEGWQFEKDNEQDVPSKTSLTGWAITAEEGVEAFSRILSITPAEQIIVSSGDLQVRANRWIRHGSSYQGNKAAEQTAFFHPRSDTLLPFVAPRNGCEQTIATIWSKVLGIDEVGINDDFFELGGHSLLATQVISRLRDAFQIELPLRSLFDASTVKALAQVIEEMLLEKLENMSEEEAQYLVQKLFE
jgi:acyl transferase domain-containing protein/acyl carrier protein